MTYYRAVPRQMTGWEDEAVGVDLPWWGMVPTLMPLAAAQAGTQALTQKPRATASSVTPYDWAGLLTKAGIIAGTVLAAYVIYRAANAAERKMIPLQERVGHAAGGLLKARAGGKLPTFLRNKRNALLPPEPIFASNRPTLPEPRLKRVSLSGERTVPELQPAFDVYEG